MKKIIVASMVFLSGCASDVKVKHVEPVDDVKKEFIYDMYSKIMADKKYYMSDVEMFARWLTFKQGLLNYGIIKDINQKVKLIDVVRGLNIKDNYNNYLIFYYLKFYKVK